MTTTVTSSSSRRLAYHADDEALIDALYARGVRAVPSPQCEGQFLFSRDASSPPVVATAVFYFSDCAQTAFTRGDLSLSDNFDSVVSAADGTAHGRRFVAVENLTFGPAKTFIERYEAYAFMVDHKSWPDARVLAALPQFAKGVDRLPSLEAALDAHPEYRALQAAPDSALARMAFIDALARRHLADVHQEVLRFGRSKGIGLEDPVFAAADASAPALLRLAADDDAASMMTTTINDYCAARVALLEHVPLANPRFSKLALGRGAWFPLIGETWERLGAWTVFFARRLQLARQAELLALPFLMLNGGGETAPHCETSDKDDLWAVKLEVPKGAESPLDALLLEHGGGDLRAFVGLWERIRAEAPTRKLGQVNALVARSLLAPDEALEGEHEAAVELVATGWVAWVDRCLPGEGTLLRPPRLPAALIHRARTQHLRLWLETLSAGLTARAAAASSSS